MNKKIREPRLRFSGFEGKWEEVSIRDLVEQRKIEIQKNGLLKYSGTKKYIKTGDVVNWSIIGYDNVSFKNKPSRANLEPKINTAYIAKMADTFKLLTFDKEDINKYILSTGFMGLKILKDINLEYLKSLLQTEYFIYQKDLYSNGTTQVAINNKSIRLIKTSFPSLPEQEKIGSFFKTLDSLIENQGKYIEKMKEKKKGLLQDIFSKKIRMKDENGKEFEGEWEEVKLGDVCEIKTGKLNANKAVENGKYPFFTCAEKPFRINKYAYEDEVLLISGNGANVGYIHYYKGKFNAYQRTYILNAFKEEVFYIQYYLELMLKKRIEIEKRDGNTPYIVMGTLREMNIFTPSNPEQKAIGNFFKTIDKKIEKEEELLNKYKMLKKALLQDMFI